MNPVSYKSVITLEEYLTLPHIFQAESKQNGRNGQNLVGMTCQ